MAVDDEYRTLLNKQLLAAARQDGNIEDLLTSVEYRDPEDEDSFRFDVNCTDFSGNTPLHLAYVARHVLLSVSSYSTYIIALDGVQPCVSHSSSIPYYSVLSGSVGNVNLLIEAEGCDVDPQNSAGDTPLHLAVQIQDRDTRYEIVFALVKTAGAVESIRLTNRAGQTPNALAKIYCPNDAEVNSLTTPPARGMNAFLDKDDLASDGEGDYPG